MFFEYRYRPRVARHDPSPHRPVAYQAPLQHGVDGGPHCYHWQQLHCK